MDRAQNLPAVATGQVGAPDAVAKQRVARHQLLLRGNPQADTALCMTGRVENEKLSGTNQEAVAISCGCVDGHRLGRLEPQPGGLPVEPLLQLHIVEVHIYRRARGLLQLLCPADVVDVRVRNDDGLQVQAMPLDDFENVVNLIARIHNQAFPAGLVAKHRAIALEQPYRKNLVDHTPIVYSTIWVMSSRRSYGGCTSRRSRP
jgi:hypothetical protein